MRFSVVIATYNRPAELARCVKALGGVKFPRAGFEVIIVNDGGSIASSDSLRALAPGVNLRVASQRNAGPGAARNTGARAANGEVLAFIDDDCIPPSDWLENLAAAVERSPDAMIGGRTINALESNSYSRASQSLVDYVYHFYNAGDSARASFFASNNMAIPARAFAGINGFDENFRTAEDRELCARWKANGGQFVYASNVIMHHAHDLSLLSLYRQHFGYGRGALPYWKKTGRGGLKGIRVEPLSFYAGMLRYPFAHGEPRPFVVASLILFSQVSNALGFAREAASSVVSREPARSEVVTLPPTPVSTAHRGLCKRPRLS
jgi:GT2 family glycosyltransferase